MVSLKLYKDYPVPSERMGMLWTLSSIKDLVLVEFGPEGTTRYLLESLKHFGQEAEAKIFTTMMDEDIVVLGNTETLLKTLSEVDRKYSPEYIFVFDSSVASVIGIDVEGLCGEFQNQIKAKLIPIVGGGLSGIWTQGVEMAFKLLANIATDSFTTEATFNILGCCVDEFNHKAEVDEIIYLIEKIFKLKVNCILSAETSLEDCKNMGNSILNIVLRKEALAAAEILKERFGIPYVYGRPYGIEGTRSWIKNIEESIGYKAVLGCIDQEFKELENLLSQVKNRVKNKEALPVIIGGHVDTIIGLKSFVAEEVGLPIYYLENAWSSQEKQIKYINHNEYRSLIEREGIVLMADGLNLRLVNEKSRIQTSHPILEEITVEQPGLMGIGGARYILNKLTNLL